MHDSQQTSSTKLPDLAAYAGIFLALLFHLATLSNRPPLFVDEAITLSRVEALLATGQTNGEFDDPVLGSGEPIEIYNPKTLYIFYAVPSLFGIAPTITTIRVMTLLAGLVIVVAIGSIASHLQGKTAGLTAMLFCLISPSFMQCAHVARPDVLAAALGFAALSTYLTRSSIAFSGFASVLAFSAHQRSIILTVPLVACLALDLLRRQVTARQLATWCGGLALGIGVVLWLDILPAYASFIDTQRLVAKAVPPPLATASLGVLATTVGEFVRLIREIYPLSSALLVLLIFRPFRTASRELKTTITALVLILITSVFCIHGMLQIKSIIFAPSIDLLLALMVFADWSRFTRTLNSGMTQKIFLVIILGSAAARNLKDWPRPDCRDRAAEFSQALAQYIQPESTVMGDEHLWLFVHDNPYISWKRLQLSRSVSELPLESLFQLYRPDYMLVDGGVERLVSDTPMDDRFLESLRLPAAEFNSVVARWGSTAGEVNLACYGQVKILRFDWNQSVVGSAKAQEQ